MKFPSGWSPDLGVPPFRSEGWRHQPSIRGETHSPVSKTKPHQSSALQIHIDVTPTAHGRHPKQQPENDAPMEEFPPHQRRAWRFGTAGPGFHAEGDATLRADLPCQTWEGGAAGSAFPEARRGSGGVPGAFRNVRRSAFYFKTGPRRVRNSGLDSDTGIGKVPGLNFDGDTGIGRVPGLNFDRDAPPRWVQTSNFDFQAFTLFLLFCHFVFKGQVKHLNPISFFTLLASCFCIS